MITGYLQAKACQQSGDANDDSRLDITDPIRILSHLFQGRGPLPEPFDRCGLDPTPAGLSCQHYAPCR
ncbi:MAG: hypothetical protein HY717_04855 [Planctomycetes bacterium]|nr:hypothetical protein [Planctomycetota bacterium]